MNIRQAISQGVMGSLRRGLRRQSPLLGFVLGLSVMLLLPFTPEPSMAQSVTNAGQQAVNFGSINICPNSQATPAPCTQTLAITFNVTASGTLGTPMVLTTGIDNLDFALAAGSTCTGAVASGSTCTVNVTFTPQAPGARNGAVEVFDNSGNLLASEPIFGIGVGPAVAYITGVTSTAATGLTYPSGIVADAMGNLYISDFSDGTVKKLTPGGSPSVVASGLGNMNGLAIDGAGNLYITPATGTNGTSSVYALAQGCASLACAALIPVNLPSGDSANNVAVDGSGNLFIASGPELIEIPRGCLSATCQTVIDDFNSGDNLFGLAVDAAGSVYVGDLGNNTVYKVPQGCASNACTLQFAALGAPYYAQPYALAVDAAGDVFVADYNEGGIYEISPTGAITTLVAPNNSTTVSPYGYTIAVDSVGNVFFGSVQGSSSTPSAYITELPRAAAPALSFAATSVGSTSSDSPKSLQLANVGNASLVASGLSVSSSFGQVGGSGTPADCSSSVTLVPGTSCNLSLSFKPSVGGAITGSAVLTDNALNASAGTQTIALSGTGLLLPQSITWASIPAQSVGTSLNLASLASASSGLAVSFSSTTPGICSATGTTVSFAASGTCTILASQTGNSSYSAATSVSQSIVVATGSQTITFGTIASQVSGTSISLSATASSGLPVSFASTTTTVCTVSGTTATLIAAGSCSIQATQTGNANYKAATPVTQSFTVTAPASSFTITPIPGSETVSSGTVGAFILELKSVKGFSGSVTLTCSGGPAGTTCVDLPMTVKVNGTALAISGIVFPKHTPNGTYTITFKGVSGAVTATATASFTLK